MFPYLVVRTQHITNEDNYANPIKVEKMTTGQLIDTARQDIMDYFGMSAEDNCTYPMTWDQIQTWVKKQPEFPKITEEIFPQQELKFDILEHLFALEQIGVHLVKNQPKHLSFLITFMGLLGQDLGNESSWAWKGVVKMN